MLIESPSDYRTAEESLVPLVSLGTRHGSSEGSHTPGPWKFGQYGCGDWWIGQDYDSPAVARVQRDGDETRDLPEIDANARLIAAAPDLLEALFRLLSALDTHSDDPTQANASRVVMAQDTARAAIRKATEARS